MPQSWWNAMSLINVTVLDEAATVCDGRKLCQCWSWHAQQKSESTARRAVNDHPPFRSAHHYTARNNIYIQEYYRTPSVEEMWFIRFILTATSATQGESIDFMSSTKIPLYQRKTALNRNNAAT